MQILDAGATGLPRPNAPTASGVFSASDITGGGSQHFIPSRHYEECHSPYIAPTCYTHVGGSQHFIPSRHYDEFHSPYIAPTCYTRVGGSQHFKPSRHYEDCHGPNMLRTCERFTAVHVQQTSLGERVYGTLLCCRYGTSGWNHSASTCIKARRLIEWLPIVTYRDMAQV